MSLSGSLLTSRFPHSAPIHFDGHAYDPETVIERLLPLISEERQRRIAEVLARRTYSVVPVLEGVHDAGNVNAVLRSSEGLGYGGAHLVDIQGEAADMLQGIVPTKPIRAQRQSQGADKWVDVERSNHAAEAAKTLRECGYRIVATHLSADAVPISEIDFSIPTAIVLGNEAEGISEAMLAEADLNCVLPIDGFIQSYNVSVAAALALYHARQDRIARLGYHGDLTDEEQRILTALYFIRSVRRPASLLAGFSVV